MLGVLHTKLTVDCFSCSKQPHARDTAPSRVPKALQVSKG